MTTKLIENVLNGHLSKDDFGKVYFLNEEAAIDFSEAYHRTKCAESEHSTWLVECFEDTTIHHTKNSSDEFIKEYKIDGGEPVVTMLYTTPQSSDAEAKLKLAREALVIAIDYQREACQTFHDSFKGYKHEDHKRYAEHLKFVEQALDKIEES